MRRVYLDHNATTPIDPEVMAVMLQALEAGHGNPSSVHREGQRARAAVEQARRQVASLIGADFTEITFTSGATEANNLALATLSMRTAEGLATSAVEHPSILTPMDWLEEVGRHIWLIPVDAQGRLPEPEAIVEQARRREIGALSLMLANNETGNLFDVAAIAALARRHGLLIHCDATQAIGKLPVDVETLGVDLLSISAHKFCGPTGVGALYTHPDVTLGPLVIGGHQERGRRGGTENTPAIIAMGAAAELAAARQPQDAAHMAALRDRLLAGIMALDPGAVRQGDPERCLPNTLNIRFPDVDGETLLINLDLEGIAVSAGSACTAGSLEPSHVILAMGVPAQEARGSVRFSLGRTTTDEDISLVLARLPAVLARTRTEPW